MKRHISSIIRSSSSSSSSTTTTKSSSTSSSLLPILDLATYYSNRSVFVEELRIACHTVGFFLIRTNNNNNNNSSSSSSSLGDKMLNECRQFFNRPITEKNHISYLNSPSFRGYMELGVENTDGKLDYREQIEYAVEYPNSSDGSSSSSSTYCWPVYERLKSSRNPWPTTFQPTLESVTKEYVKETCKVADCIRDSLCLALNLDPSALSNKFVPTTTSTSTNNNNNKKKNDEVPHWVIKMISYPPSPQYDEDHQGVGAHTDTNFLTLVLQDDIGGLQAFSQGRWIDVPANYGSSVLVCNLGEQAEIWSGGYFLATPHRVLPNSNRRNRISVPLFYNPILSATIEPLEEETILDNVIWDRPKITTTTTNNNHWRRENNKLLPTVGDNTFKSLARSHPTVFQKHHPDLILLPNGEIIQQKDTIDGDEINDNDSSGSSSDNEVK